MIATVRLPHRVPRFRPPFAGPASLWRAAALAALVIVGVCARPADARRTPSGKIELRVWNQERIKRSEGGRRPLPPYVAMFQQRNPDIEIVSATTLRVEKTHAGAESGELMAIAGGLAPDVFDEAMFGRKLQTYAEQGFCAPLDEYIDDYARRTGRPYEGIFAPAPIWESCKYNGHYYGVPRAYYTMQLYWRKDIFRKHGLDPNAPPKDWDELFRIAMAVTEPSDEPMVIAGKLVPGGKKGILLYARAWPFMNFIWSTGAEVLTPNLRCPNCNALVPVERPFVDFRAEHVHVREEEYYYDHRPDEHKVCPHCGATVVETTVAGELERPGRKLEWRMTIDDPRAMRAFDFYHKLIWQRWTRCTRGHADPAFEITDAMRAAGQATCPRCGTAYPIAALEREGRLYRGVAAVGREGEEVDPVVEDQFVQGRMAMLVCWGGVANALVNKGLAREYIGQTPFPEAPGGRRSTFIAGGFYAINATSDKESRDAAWKYIEFMTSLEVQRIGLEHDARNGNALYDWPSKLLRYGFTDILREVPQAWIDVEPQLMRTARIEPYAPGSQTLYEHIGVPLAGIERDENYDYAAEVRDRVDYVNRRLLGEPTAEELRQKTRLTWVLLVAIAAVAGAGVWLFGVRAARSVRAVRRRATIGGLDVYSSGSRRRKMLYATAFLFAAMVSITLWAYIPLAAGTAMAVYDYRIVGEGHFVGLRHFVDILWDEVFYQTMARTFIYVGLTLGMGFVVPIVLAVLLHEVPKGKVLFRLLYYLPAITTPIVTMFLWKRLLLDPTDLGLLNQVLHGASEPIVNLINGVFGTSLHPIPTQLWLQDPRWAMICVIVPGIWAGAGPGCLIYLAALKAVPEEEYEAAEIDGAGIVRKFFSVTLPNLSALILINFIGAFIGAFHAMENIFVMTGGGPGRATYVVGLDIWLNAFMYLKFGYATAMAWILGSLLVAFTVYQIRVMTNVQFRTTGSAAT